jgi:hypothetical protein
MLSAAGGSGHQKAFLAENPLQPLWVIHVGSKFVNVCSSLKAERNP